MEPTGEFLIEKEHVYSGALSCRGCGWSLLVRHLSSILGEETVYVVPACCFSIIAGPYPMNALKGNIVHTVFAAAPATATGVRAALDRQGKEDVPVVVLAGDGGTFDIGLQSMSGAATRGENILYICNNNGAYMNTGIQSSTATPMGAATSTNPVSGFKKTWPKDMLGIVAAHHVPYVASASLAFMKDFRRKIEKAVAMHGFRMLMIDGPCPPGHKVAPDQAIDLGRMVVNARLFPLYEVENGKYKLNYIPPVSDRVKVEVVLKRQGRFRHLFSGKKTQFIEEIQRQTDRQWERLEHLVTIDE